MSKPSGDDEQLRPVEKERLIRMAEDYGDWQKRAGLQINEELLFETELDAETTDQKQPRYIQFLPTFAMI